MEKLFVIEDDILVKNLLKRLSLIPKIIISIKTIIFILSLLLAVDLFIKYFIESYQFYI